MPYRVPLTPQEIQWILSNEGTRGYGGFAGIPDTGGWQDPGILPGTQQPYPSPSPTPYPSPSPFPPPPDGRAWGYNPLSPPPNDQPSPYDQYGYGGGSPSMGGNMNFGGYSGQQYGGFDLGEGYGPGSMGYDAGGYGGGSMSTGGNIDMYSPNTYGALPSSDQYGYSPVDYGSTGGPSMGGNDISGFGGDMSLGGDLPSASDPYLGIPGYDAGVGVYQSASGSAQYDPSAGGAGVTPDGMATPSGGGSSGGGYDPYAGAVVGTPFTGGVYNFSGLPTYTQYYQGNQMGSSYGFDPYGSAIGTAPNQASQGGGGQVNSQVGMSMNPSGWGSSTKPPTQQQATEPGMWGGNWKRDDAYYSNPANFQTQVLPPDFNIWAQAGPDFNMYTGGKNVQKSK